MVTVQLDAASYTLDEDIGTTTDEVRLIAKTASGVPAPNVGFVVSISTRTGTATSVDDYEPLSLSLLIPGASPGADLGSLTGMPSWRRSEHR